MTGHPQAKASKSPGRPVSAPPLRHQALSHRNGRNTRHCLPQAEPPGDCKEQSPTNRPLQMESRSENRLLFQTTEIGGLFMIDTPLGKKSCPGDLYSLTEPFSSPCQEVINY